MKITIFINRDIDRIIKAKQFDALSRFLDVTLLDDGGSPYDLNDCRVQFNGLKSDGNYIMNNAVITDAANGKFTVELTDQTLAVGNSVLRSDISVFSNDAKVILTTRTFLIHIQSTIRNDKATESSNEYNSVVTLFQDVWDMQEVIKEMNARFGNLSDDLAAGNEQAGSSALGGINRIWNYLKTQSTAAIVETVNIIKNLVDGLETIRQVRFDSPGTYTWIAPMNVTEILLTACGGGGGGAYYGGGGAAAIIDKKYPVVPGGVYTIIVGKGGEGTGSLEDNTRAESGGFTSMSDTVTLPGGGGAYGDGSNNIGSSSGKYNGESGGVGGGSGGNGGGVGSNNVSSGIGGASGGAGQSSGGGGSLGGGGGGATPSNPERYPGGGDGLYGAGGSGYITRGGAGGPGAGGGGGGGAVSTLAVPRGGSGGNGLVIIKYGR